MGAAVKTSASGPSTKDAFLAGGVRSACADSLWPRGGGRRGNVPVEADFVHMDVLSKKGVMELAARIPSNRKVVGLGTPIELWLHQGSASLVSEVLSDSAVKARGIFQPEAVSLFVNTFQRGGRDVSQSLMYRSRLPGPRIGTAVGISSCPKRTIGWLSVEHSKTFPRRGLREAG